jgi:hypothetical protein
MSYYGTRLNQRLHTLAEKYDQKMNDLADRLFEDALESRQSIAEKYRHYSISDLINSGLTAIGGDALAVASIFLFKKEDYPAAFTFVGVALACGLISAKFIHLFSQDYLSYLNELNEISALQNNPGYVSGELLEKC